MEIREGEMTGIKNILDAISETAKNVRSDYHLTLGDLIALLEAKPSETIVRIDDKTYPGQPMSYRGYYSDLAFPSSETPATCASLLEDCKGAMRFPLTGYKGGEFQMDKKTPLWLSEYGTSSGIAILGYDDRDGEIVLLTKQIRD